MFNVGDNVCYLSLKNGKKQAFQSMVLEVKEKIKISYHESTKQNVIWVNPADIELINTSRCAHNVECGWCEDEGKCIYE